MTCGEVRECLFAFLDGELDAPLSIELQRHLDHCPDCAREAEIERATHARLGAFLNRHAEASDPIEQELLRAITRRIGRPRWFSSPRRVVLATAAAAAFCILAGWWWVQPDQNSPLPAGLADLLVDDFRESLERNPPLQIASDDALELSKWAGTVLAANVRVPPSDEGLRRLMGARRCRIAGAPAVLVAYEVRAVPVALVVFDPRATRLAGVEELLNERGPHSERCRGYTVTACGQDGLLYAAVSTLPADALAELVGVAR